MAPTALFGVYDFGANATMAVQVEGLIYFRPVGPTGRLPSMGALAPDGAIPANAFQVLGEAQLFKGEDGEIAIVMPPSWREPKILAGRELEELRWCRTLRTAEAFLTSRSRPTHQLDSDVRTSLMPVLRRAVEKRPDRDEFYDLDAH